MVDGLAVDCLLLENKPVVCFWEAAVYCVAIAPNRSRKALGVANGVWV